MASSYSLYNRLGHPNLFTPTSSEMSIGLNRHHMYNSYGSGLCRAYCQVILGSFTSQSQSDGTGSGGNTGGTGGSDIENNDPEGTSAPSLDDLDKL